MTGFDGTGALAGLALRRSRIMAVAWLAGFVVTAWVSAAATVGLYPTTRSRVEAAAAINDSRALVALYGRVYDPTSLGAVSMIKMGGLGAVFVAMMTIVLVSRHTRADEESGRRELLASTSIGRRAPLAAALVAAAVLDVSLATLTAAVLMIAGLPVSGSLAFGLAWGSVGLAFAGVAALAAQVTPSARTATSLAAAVVAVVYVARAVGDAAPSARLRWLAWLSPIGWSQQFRPYAGDRWAVLVLLVAFAAATAAGALALAARRDLGTGLLAPRPGPVAAPGWLRSPTALAWRLSRSSFVGWGIGFLSMGALLGSLAQGVGGFFTSQSARDFFTKLGGEKGLSDAFLAAELGFAGIAAAAYGIQAVLRLRAEEAGGRAEPLLAGPLGRARFAGAHLAVAAAETCALLALAGLGAGVTRAVQVGDAAEIGRMLAAALVHAPAACVVLALTFGLFGAAPRAVSLGWALLAAIVVLAEIGPLLDLSHWVMDVSPFAHVPKLPGAAVRATPLAALSAIAAAAGAAGLVTFRRRDLT